MNRFFIIFLIVFLAAAGCNKDETSIDKTNYASVSVYAVVPDAPEFTLSLNGSVIAVDVPFGSYTLYNKIAEGDVVLHAQSASRDITIDTSFSVAASQYYSFFLTGNSGSIRPVVLHDVLPSLSGDSCGLRFFVVSPGVSGVDFYVVSSDTTHSIKKGWANRSYTNNMMSDTVNTFKKFAAGTYSFYAVNSTNISDTIARFTNQSFSDSANYTLMLEGHLNSSDTSLLLGTRLHNGQ